MKRYIYNICVALAVAALSQGCTKFLDTVPDERTQLNSVDKVSALLTSAYPHSSFAALVHFRCDYVTDFGSTGPGGQPISLMQFAGDGFIWKEQIESGNDREEIFWTNCYAAIAASNHALQALDKLPEQEGRKARGEAYMARAFSHFYLVSLFSELYNSAASINPGIPYVTQPEDTPIQMYDRSTVADTYEKIEADINAGFPLMTDGVGFHAPKYHFTRTSAAAFAARFYLMKGDYTNVLKYANMVLPQPSNFITITDADGADLKNSDGSVVKNVATTDPAIVFVSNNFQSITSYASTGSAPTIMTLFSASKTASNLLLSEARTSIGLTGYSYYSRFAMSQANAISLISSNMGTTGDCIYLAITYAQDARFFIPKYKWETEKESISASFGYPYSIIPMLRMEEVLLNRAEAYVMLDDFDKAIADMNVYLSQRTVVDVTSQADRLYNNKTLFLSKDRALAATADERAMHSFINQYNETSTWPEVKKALILLILRYRNQEFWQEGLRWYDIRRWNIPVKHSLSNGTSNTLMPGDGRRLLQIPESALLSGVEKNERQNINDVWQ